jgi:hypothetical protein
MRRNITGLLSQFGFGVKNDLLAVLIIVCSFAGLLTVLHLVGAL